MKKILIMTMLLLLAGCSSIKTKEEYKNGITLSSMDDVPSVTELVELKEGVEATLSLEGNRILVTTVEDKPQEIEIPITFETMDIDGTQDVDLSKFYSNPEKLSTASYSINEDRTVMTVTDSEKSFEVPVNVIFPKYTIASDIVIDTYLGYDVHDFVTCDTDGVEITSVLKEDDSQIIISLKKGIWDISEIKDVTLTSSSPFPMTFVSRYGWNGVYLPFDEILKFTLLSPNEAAAWSHYTGDFDIELTDFKDDNGVYSGVLTYLADDRDPNNYRYEVCKFKVEGDDMYYCIDELNRGVTPNIKGSYYYFERAND